MTDQALEQATAIVRAAHEAPEKRPTIAGFFDENTFTVTYVVHDAATKQAAIIDSVLDYDQASGRTGFESAERVLDYVAEKGIEVAWVMESHAHADHLSAARKAGDRQGHRARAGCLRQNLQCRHRLRARRVAIRSPFSRR